MRSFIPFLLLTLVCEIHRSGRPMDSLEQASKAPPSINMPRSARKRNTPKRSHIRHSLRLNLTKEIPGGRTYIWIPRPRIWPLHWRRPKPVDRKTEMAMVSWIPMICVRMNQRVPTGSMDARTAIPIAMVFRMAKIDAPMIGKTWMGLWTPMVVRTWTMTKMVCWIRSINVPISRKTGMVSRMMMGVLKGGRPGRTVLLITDNARISQRTRTTTSMKMAAQM